MQPPDMQRLSHILNLSHSCHFFDFREKERDSICFIS